MSDRPENPTGRAVIDADSDQLSVLVTFDWRRAGLYLDGCEAAVVVGEVRRTLAEHFGQPEWTQLAGLAAVETWDPLEERHIGGPNAVRGERWAEVRFLREPVHRAICYDDEGKLECVCPIGSR